MLFYDLSAIAAPIVYDTSMISPPTAQSKGKWLYYERYYYGMFGLRQRQAGVFANIASAPTIASLTVTSTAASGAGKTTINAGGAQIGQLGTPAAGLKMYYSAGNSSAPSVTYGAALPAGTWTEVPAAPFNLSSQTAGKYVTVALVNAQTGFAVAVGSAVEVVGT